MDLKNLVFLSLLLSILCGCSPVKNDFTVITLSSRRFYNRGISETYVLHHDFKNYVLKEHSFAANDLYSLYRYTENPRGTFFQNVFHTEVDLNVYAVRENTDTSFSGQLIQLYHDEYRQYFLPYLVIFNHQDTVFSYQNLFPDCIDYDSVISCIEIIIPSLDKGVEIDGRELPYASNKIVLQYVENEKLKLDESDHDYDYRHFFIPAGNLFDVTNYPADSMRNLNIFLLDHVEVRENVKNKAYIRIFRKIKKNPLPV